MLNNLQTEVLIIKFRARRGCAMGYFICLCCPICQHTSSTLPSPLQSAVSLSAIYCPRNKSVPPNVFLAIIQSLGPPYFAGGDFDAKLQRNGCRIPNTRGSILPNEVHDSLRCNILSPKPTPTPQSI